MAKDGTRRGGARPGCGRKPKSLIEKINEGIEKPLKKTDGFEPAEFERVDMPPIKEYLKSKQKNGKDLGAEAVYKEMWLWLKEVGCEKLVSTHLIEQYAMTFSRWIQCQEAVSEFGYLAKHPTTGAAISSPYVKMVSDFLKQVNQIWFQIYQIVRDNAISGYNSNDPKDEVMERLLNSRRFIK